MSRKRRIDWKRNRRNAEKRSGGNLKTSRGGECGGASKFPGWQCFHNSTLPDDCQLPTRNVVHTQYYWSTNTLSDTDSSSNNKTSPDWSLARTKAKLSSASVLFSSVQSSSVQYVVNQPLCPSAECLFVRVHQSGVSVGVPHNQRVSVHARLNFQCPPSPWLTMRMARVKAAASDKCINRSVPICQ